ncbi:MAG: translation initiation factor IF-1A [Candidatus Hodarchaeota archaeon]
MSPKKVRNRKRKKDRTPPELFMKAKVEQQTAEGLTTMVIRVRKPALGELFAIVLRNLGDNRVRVQCADGNVRIGRIRGRMRKRAWIRVGDVVLVEPWYGLDEETKGDVKHRYRMNEKRVLEDRGMLKALENYL